MIGYTSFKLLEKTVLKYSGVDLPDEGIYAIDAVFLAIQWLYGHGPKSLSGMLFTASVYGLPALLKLANQDKAAHWVEHLPKLYSRVWMVYTVVAMIALALAAGVVIPMVLQMLNTSQSPTPSSAQSSRQVKRAAAPTKAGPSVNYDADEEYDKQDDTASAAGAGTNIKGDTRDAAKPRKRAPRA